MRESSDVTILLDRINEGDGKAPEELLPLVYGELRKLAHSYLQNERADHTLQATALVHEAYIRLVDWENVSWQNRAHFFAVAANVMRKILVDHARQKKAQKRDSGRKLSLDEAVSFPLGDNLRLQAQVFYAKGNLAEAEKKINEALQIYRQSSTTQYPNYPSALILQGLILNRKNQSPEAEKFLREALKLRTDSLPKEHFWVSLAEGALGECLLTQRKYAEAETLLTDSFENLKKSQGAENPRTETARQKLLLLNQQMKNPESKKGK